jgi:SAM-dependent methyltransferase
LRAALGEFVIPNSVIVDVGSADGPSAEWLDEVAWRIPLDNDVRGLGGEGLCASALALPFADSTLDAVSVFDVVEHFPDDLALLGELRRVLRPRGRLLLSVPAYQWAWSSFDVQAGHYRRYTRSRLVEQLHKVGFVIERATYAFAATLPFFVVDRLRARMRGSGALRVARDVHSRWLEQSLLRLTRADEAMLASARLPFGSSLFAAASLPR